ncbi:hypothetical protein [Aeromicrobium piscarium]|uniref:hypothetical protein n=1 Tax=Aeromicrobium piscarium TaxID=2590901 RepID=UPI00163DD844|nr:hypothetical protein [Aeromicrobium piscarium]
MDTRHTDSPTELTCTACNAPLVRRRLQVQDWAGNWQPMGSHLVCTGEPELHWQQPDS